MPAVRLAAAALLAATAVTACSGGGHSAPTDDGQLVQVSVSNCGKGWSAEHAGPQHLRLQNTDSAAGEAFVVSPRTGAVYADVEPLGPQTTVDLQVTLGAGSYALRCAMEDKGVVTGPTVTLTGSTANAAPGVVPIDQAQLIPYTLAYERTVRAALPGLTTEVRTLRGDVAGGDLTRARADWIVAHQAYERLGAAYDAFGDLDGAINGTAAGLPDGVSDPGFTGFHRVEYGLWHGASAAAVLPWIDQLVDDLADLTHQFQTAQLEPGQLAIRAHEISENAVQFELTGATDYGSHTELATVAANLDGTVSVLNIVRPLLVARQQNLGPIDAELAHAAALVNAEDHDGRWTALTALPSATRAQLNATMSELCERLAAVASVLEPRVIK